MKKLFIKICKFLGYEIIDQNSFSSPTLDKELNEDLSILNQKSIILPLGEVKITKKVNSILIIFRMNTDIEIWDQNRKRLFEYPKIEYSKRSLNSLIKSIKFLKDKYPTVNVKIIIVDDNSKDKNLLEFKDLIDNNNIELINLEYSKFENKISKQKNKETFANLASLLQCFEIGKEKGEDLIYFVEDDYLHKKNSIKEMIFTYERISSQINREIIICPADYPYLYAKTDATLNFLGHKCHWRKVGETLCTFLTSKQIIEKYWDKYVSMCQREHAPFEKPMHEIYEKELCISPIPSLAVHFTNINSIFGLSPNMDWKKSWDENEN